MAEWAAGIDLEAPYWVDYRELMASFGSDAFPTVRELNARLPAGARSRSGRPIRFVSAAEIPGVAYEPHIHDSGEVSTRDRSWHDLFNALVWIRYPHLKAAMNAVHQQHWGGRRKPARGPVRDALTLLDESGVVVVSTNRQRLQQLAGHRWTGVFAGGFTTGPTGWAPEQLNVFIIGHALLEKFLDPFKSVTAKALLMHLSSPPAENSREAVREAIDRGLARRLLQGENCRTPRELSPIPLMGIPGWWPNGPQDEPFYADTQVFRPPPPGRPPAPVFSMSLDPGHGDNSPD